MSQALRKLTGNIKRSNTLVIFINQIRMKIGVMFGSPETTTGGNALKCYSSARLDIRRIGAIRDKNDVTTGNQTRVKIVKNKMASPFRQAEFEIIFGEGTSPEGELIELGVEHGLIEKSGAWYSYDGDRIGQGKEKVRTWLKEQPQIRSDIDQSLRALLLPQKSDTSTQEHPEVLEDTAGENTAVPQDNEESEATTKHDAGLDESEVDAQANHVQPTESPSLVFPGKEAVQSPAS